MKAKTATNTQPDTLHSYFLARLLPGYLEKVGSESLPTEEAAIDKAHQVVGLILQRCQAPSSNEGNMTAAETAVLKILQRVATSRDFSWLMAGTETLRLCLVAEAQRLGTSADDVEEKLSAAMMRDDERRRRQGELTTAEVLIHRHRVEAIEQLLTKVFAEGGLTRNAYDQARMILGTDNPDKWGA
ncbi:hypothetical protein [Bremerella cremea]|uniref:hypothetical protein n=1 Tax=Bremerella cremea TaxID=1031537 RepID=UPI0031F09FB2